MWSAGTTLRAKFSIKVRNIDVKCKLLDILRDTICLSSQAVVTNNIFAQYISKWFFFKIPALLSSEENGLGKFWIHMCCSAGAHRETY